MQKFFWRGAGLALFLCPIGLAVLCGAEVFAQPMVDATLTGFNMNICSEVSGKCAQIQGEAVEQSQFKQLFYMRPITVNVKKQSGEIEKTISGLSGYVDLDENIAVVRGLKGESIVKLIDRAGEEP